MKLKKYVLFALVSIVLLLSLAVGLDENAEVSAGSVAAAVDISKGGHVEFDLSEKLALAPPATDQERIDTLVRAFKHLPLEEQAKIGVDLNEPVAAGSERASSLYEAWVQRQKLFREAMDSLMKPAEKMAEMVQILQNVNNTADDSYITTTLTDLEVILGDIDNARDFHTIGGWPTLVGMLSSTRPTEHRSLAALAIGTAVKNSYDFQLWSLEKVFEEGSVNPVDMTSLFKDLSGPQVVRMSLKELLADKKSGVDLLTEILWSEAAAFLELSEFQCNITIVGEDALLRRSLYAVSSAARGNPDVQQALLEALQIADVPYNSSFLWSLEQLSNPCLRSSVEVARKVWAFVVDMLDEREYARVTLYGSPEFTPQMREELLALPLLGDHFCTSNWAYAAHNAIVGILERYPYELLSKLFADYSENQEHAYELIDTDVMGLGEQSAMRSTLESISLTVSHLEDQCQIDVPIEINGPVAALLQTIRTSTRAKSVHESSFHDMNSTYTYSDSQY
jgi:uncharacterized protein Yka (UPF0111/DUF47 family)